MKPNNHDKIIESKYGGNYTVTQSASEQIHTIMGIDLSLNGTAITILNIGMDDYRIEHQVFAFSSIKSLKKKFPDNIIYQDKELKGVERLEFINKEINDIIENKRIGPYISDVAMEDYSFASIGRQFSIGELGGVIKLLIYSWNKSLTIYKPTEIKKFISGKGNAPKSTILLEVYKKFGIDFSIYDSSSDDVADSYVIAHMLYNDLYLKKGDKK